MEDVTNFETAVKEGILIDVSHIAVRIGLLCPTFVTSALWNSVEISCSEQRLLEVLDGCCPIHELVGAGKFGKETFGVGGGPSCPWIVGVTGLVEHFDGRGTVVVVGDSEEELDFRGPRSAAGGSFYSV